MIDVNSITNALYTTISSNSTIVNSGISVDLNEVFNTDPNRTPWVGIYRGPVNIEPRHIGGSKPWHAVYDLRVYVQAASFESGQNANNLLDETLNVVLDAVNANRRLDNTVLHIAEMSTDPFDRSIEEEQWFYTDELVINAENEV